MMNLRTLILIRSLLAVVTVLIMATFSVEAAGRAPAWAIFGVDMLCVFALSIQLPWPLLVLWLQDRKDLTIG